MYCPEKTLNYSLERQDWSHVLAGAYSSPHQPRGAHMNYFDVLFFTTCFIIPLKRRHLSLLLFWRRWLLPRPSVSLRRPLPHVRIKTMRRSETPPPPLQPRQQSQSSRPLRCHRQMRSVSPPAHPPRRVSGSPRPSPSTPHDAPPPSYAASIRYSKGKEIMRPPNNSSSSLLRNATAAPPTYSQSIAG